MRACAIQLWNVTKDFPGARALDGVSFGVGKGSIHGFAGPNGAGKSTALKIITGLIRPGRGRVVLQEGAGIGFLPERPPLYENMTVEDYLRFVFDLYTLNRPADPAGALEKCGLRGLERRRIGWLSKGQRQRLGIAQALVHAPRLLVLDEPMSGLDPEARRETRELLRKLRGEHTILLSGHQLREMELLCDEMTIIDRGRVIRSGPLEDLRESLGPGRALVLRLRRWSDTLGEELKERFGARNLSVSPQEEGVRVRLELPGDLREQLSLSIAERGLGLLEMSEELPDLEALFCRAVGSEREARP